MSLSVFSLNVWNLNGDYRARMKKLDEYLVDVKPDIVCLQEISVDPNMGRPQTIELPGYASMSSQFYSSQGKWGEREEGLATFSRLPVVAFDSFMLPEAPQDMQRRVQFLVVRYKKRKVLVANTHLAYHLDREEDRVEQCTVIEEHLVRASAQHNTSGIIVAGDLNTLPDTKTIDVLKGSKLRLVDIFEGSIERSTSFSFPKESPYMDTSLWPDRWIDYIFTSHSISVESRRLTLNGGPDAPFVSDHVALEAIVEFSE